MTIGELRDLIANQDDDMPVILWNENNGNHGEAEYLTFTDGQATICGHMS